MNDDLKKDDELSQDEIEETHAEDEDDVVFEENTEVTSVDADAKFAKLKKRIKELEKEKADLLNNWQRDKADFINARKHDSLQQENFIKFAKEDVTSELISVLDSFESAFKNKEAWEKVDKNWRVGVEYIHSQLVGVLSNHGVSVINPIGQIFDPNRDDAVESVEVDKKEDDHKVIEVLNLGYKLHDKIIRAPKVKVGEYKK
ncbi:MAG: nucleotide exchange factor GrpE [Candidatus Paceibacterota bacterium]